MLALKLLNYYIWLKYNAMSDKEIQDLKKLAEAKLEEAKFMTKTQAIHSLNDAGILTTKGRFKKNYRPLEELFEK